MLESRSRDYVESRVRAGVLEQGTVDLLIAEGVGERLEREGIVHYGIELRFGGEGHRIPFDELTDGRGITIYGQQEVVKDLIAARLEAELPLRFGAEATGLAGIESETPAVTYSDDDGEHELRCDFVAGCDGFHGICREALPDGALGGARAGLSLRLARDPRRGAAVERGAHLRLQRARLRAPQPALTRAQPAVRAVRPGRRARVLAGRADLGRARPAARARRRLGARPRADRREGHRPDAQLRRRADAARPPLPRRRRRAHRPGDRGQGPQPGDRRRARARRGARRLLRRRRPLRPRLLLRDLPAPRLARSALRLVDDGDAAPLSGLRGRVPASGCSSPSSSTCAARGPPLRGWPRTTWGPRRSTTRPGRSPPSPLPAAQ